MGSPEDVAVRQANVDDAPAIVGIIAAVAAEGRWIGTEVPFDVAERLARLEAALNEGRAASFVAERDGEIVGELTLFVRERSASFGICINDRHRDAGLGRQLIARAFAWCEQHDLDDVTLGVFAHNTGAIHLYESMGFQEAGEREWTPRENGDSWETITMKAPVRRENAR